MKISESSWINYITKLSKVNTVAAEKMREFLKSYDLESDKGREQLINMAYALATRYGEAAAEIACEMYDAMAEASGLSLPSAEPAATATISETAKAINGTLKRYMDIDQTASTVGRLVKTAGQDTTLKNAMRDGAEYAWIPHGDTCVFCQVLASRGWQVMSKNALKGDHAEHIHPNCDCAYAIRFDDGTTYAGYDPDKYLEAYENAEGTTSNEKLNSMRRMQYSQNKDLINAQKREAYALNHPHKTDMGKPNEDGTERTFHKTVGARLFKGDIVDFETGMTYHISEGEGIKNVKTFAGKGASEPYYKAYKYANKIGGDPEEWKHMKGEAYVENEYESGLAEIHWSEHDEYGSYDPFIKKWL